MERMATGCANCPAKLSVPADAAGKRFRCPKCGAMNVVAAPPAPDDGELTLSRPEPAPGFSPPSQTPLRASAQDVVELQAVMARANKSSMQWLRWTFILAVIPLALAAFSKAKPHFEPEQISAAFELKLKERLDRNPVLSARVEELQKGGFSLDLFIAWAQAFEDAEWTARLEKLETEISRSTDIRDAKVQAAISRALEKPKEEFMLKKSGLLPPPFLPKKTWGHWALAGIAAVAFLAYFCFAYPRGNAKVGQLLGIGLFTGTVGILLLLLVQILSGLAAGFRVLGHGVLVLVWVILRALAYSYAAADDPSNGFFQSFLGFTLGVGLLEELCKVLPLIWLYRRGRDLGALAAQRRGWRISGKCAPGGAFSPDWRGACVFGLASGAGFGISEGIMYSARYYNGESGLDIYIVRFVSCVAMHAAWAGAAAILLYRRREVLQGEMETGDWLKVLAPVLAAPMVLHGLYDTLLKMEMAPLALAAGAASYVFFIWLQEREARRETAASMRLMGAGR